MNMSYSFVKDEWYDYLAYHCGSKPMVRYGLPYYYMVEEDEGEEVEETEDLEEE